MNLLATVASVAPPMLDEPCFRCGAPATVRRDITVARARAWDQSVSVDLKRWRSFTLVEPRALCPSCDAKESELEQWRIVAAMVIVTLGAALFWFIHSLR